jgi:adenylate kinase
VKNRIVLLGPPATGKGTQAALLSATFGISAASTGAMLRAEKAKGSEIGREADSWTSQGRLFPDELALRVVWQWIDGRKRFILDGFPRTVGQAEAFDAGLEERGLPLDQVYFLELPEETIRERMSSRLTCSDCGAVFNEKFHNLTSGATCPTCTKGELARRNDDTIAALDNRLAQYREHTLPVAEHYRSRGLLHSIDASAGRDAVYHTLYEDIKGEDAL